MLESLLDQRNGPAQAPGLVVELLRTGDRVAIGIRLAEQLIRFRLQGCGPNGVLESLRLFVALGLLPLSALLESLLQGADLPRQATLAQMVLVVAPQPETEPELLDVRDSLASGRRGREARG